MSISELETPRTAMGDEEVSVPATCADETAPNSSTLERALKEKKELQEAIKAAMCRLEKIEQFLSMYRAYATGEEVVEPLSEAPPTLARRTGGNAQAVFEHYAKTVLRDAARPMQSGEMVEEFRKRGHPIGGENETKTAWNRLWSATRGGVLEHHPKLGYWIKDEPLSPEAEAAALEAVSARRAALASGGRQPTAGSHGHTGRPRGRRRLFTEAAFEAAKKMVAEGRTMKEAAQELGVSVQTIYVKFRAEKTGNLAAAPTIN